MVKLCLGTANVGSRYGINQTKLKTMKFIHRNFVPKHWESVTSDTVGTWYQQGIIEKVTSKKSPVNLPLITHSW